MTDSAHDLWRTRSAYGAGLRDRLVLGALTGFGLISVWRLADFWFRREHMVNPVLFAILSLAFWYGVSRIVLSWVSYTRVRRPEYRPATPGLRVAIFTTSSPGEPLAMFEKTLAACARIRYPHTTYLLDDTRDPRFR